MADSVKSIFKILIKVPIIILVCFGIFNIFTFGMCYFKMIGLSYVVMQTAIENNYIPDEDRQTLERYMKSMETGVLSNIRLSYVDGGSENISEAYKRKQYGEPVAIGVAAKYHFIWPLTHYEQTVSGVEGMGGSSAVVDPSGKYQFEGWKSDQELQALRNARMNPVGNAGSAGKGDWNKANDKTTIRIQYLVPGLKYYPDLE